MTVEKQTPAAQPDGEEGPRSRAIAAVDERLGLSTFRYPVPEHANTLGWSLGGLTATSLVVLIATGVLLTQYFNPTPEAANVSTRAIVTDVPLGEFTRSLHFWAAQAMYVLVALHLIRVFLTGSYKRPREGNWLIGVGMFALVIGAVFTGTVIKWDQEGFEALEHNLAMGDLVGVLGVLAVLFPPEVGPTPRAGDRGYPPAVDVLVVVDDRELLGDPRDLVGTCRPVRSARHRAVRGPPRRALLAPPPRRCDARRGRAADHGRADGPDDDHDCGGAPVVTRIRLTFWGLVVVTIVVTRHRQKSARSGSAPST